MILFGGVSSGITPDPTDGAYFFQTSPEPDSWHGDLVDLPDNFIHYFFKK